MGIRSPPIYRSPSWPSVEQTIYLVYVRRTLRHKRSQEESRVESGESRARSGGTVRARPVVGVWLKMAGGAIVEARSGRKSGDVPIFHPVETEMFWRLVSGLGSLAQQLITSSLTVARLSELRIHDSEKLSQLGESCNRCRFEQLIAVRSAHHK